MNVDFFWIKHTSFAERVARGHVNYVNIKR